MMTTLYSGSGCGKTGLVMAYAKGPLLVMAPDSKKVRRMADAMGRKDVRIAKVDDLYDVEENLDSEDMDEHEGIVVLEDFKALCGVTLRGLVEKADRIKAERDEWGALKMLAGSCLLRLARRRSILCTNAGELSTKETGPAAGSRTTADMIVENSVAVYPLRRFGTKSRYVGRFAKDLWLEEAEKAVDAEAESGAPKATGSDTSKKGAKGSKPSKAERAVARNKARKKKIKARLATAEAARPYLWHHTTVPVRWPVCVDMTNDEGFAKSPHLNPTYYPPFGPILDPDLFEVRDDKASRRAMKEYLALRAGELQFAEAKSSRELLMIQHQIVAWTPLFHLANEPKF